MPGLVPGIHVLPSLNPRKTWMAGTSPAMTKKRIVFRELERFENVGCTSNQAFRVKMDLAARYFRCLLRSQRQTFTDATAMSVKCCQFRKPPFTG
jgi:hypothetical protein